MIHLFKHGPEPTPEEQQAWEEHYQNIFGKHIIARKDFCVKPTAEELQAINEWKAGIPTYLIRFDSTPFIPVL